MSVKEKFAVDLSQEVPRTARSHLHQVVQEVAQAQLEGVLLVQKAPVVTRDHPHQVVVEVVLLEGDPTAVSLCWNKLGQALMALGFQGSILPRIGC